MIDMNKNYNYIALLIASTDVIKEAMDKLNEYGLTQDTTTIGDYLCVNRGVYYLINDPEDFLIQHQECIYCRDNIDLFIALATIRSDSDKYQWFYVEEPMVSWNLGQRVDRGVNMFCVTDHFIGEKYHKATLNELKEKYILNT